jgi:hypothetical protein
MPATIGRMAEQFRVLPRGDSQRNPPRRISDLPLMTQEESHRVLVEWNNVRPEAGTDRRI